MVHEAVGWVLLSIVLSRKADCDVLLVLLCIFEEQEGEKNWQLLLVSGSANKPAIKINFHCC